MQIEINAHEVRVGDEWNGFKVISVSLGETVLITLESDVSPRGISFARGWNDVMLVDRFVPRLEAE